MLDCLDIELNPGTNLFDVKSLDIFHLNTRCIRYKIEYINDLVDNFHILCFSETHLDNNIDSESIQLHGFDLPIRRDRSHNSGGVMIFMSSLLKYTRREDLENPKLETIWVEVNLKFYNILVCCFYRSDFVASQSLFITG